MAEAAEYRFLPWVRRGLAAGAGGSDPADGGPLPARAATTVGVTITGAGPASMPLTLYGPGDVLGIDTQLIVRTDPRPHSSDVEPNYLPAVEFDPPDFPWIFTPAAAGFNQRLRPWLVLICVDRAVVAPPHMPKRGPLPVIEVPGSAVAAELPDLRESWAWAHAQVATGVGAGAVTPAALDAGDLNVSRLICPRHLKPGRRYVACLVPAFDAGVLRGLTGTPPADGPIGPAWDVEVSTDLDLPVYFHWEFATGPEGDFEELAGRLDPFVCPPTVGAAPMHVGHAGPELSVIEDGKAGARLDMDGALRAPSRDSGTTADVAAPLREGLRKATAASADFAEGAGKATTPIVGPPLYGEWHIRRHRVASADTGWFGELNLDPRTRAAAGLATEVVRRNQEDLMATAWEQVGSVQDANELLNRGRLSLEVARRLHERHLQPLPDHRLLQLAGPMGTRVRLGSRTVTATVRSTSLPNAGVDPALRRLVGGRHPAMRRAAGRPGAAAPMRLVANLAEARGTVDPNVFDLDGLGGTAALEGVPIPSSGAELVDLGKAGVPLKMPADVLRDGRARYRAAADSIKGLPEGMTAGGIRTRPDLRDTGIFTPDRLLAAGLTPGKASATALGDGMLPELVVKMREQALRNPGAAALLIDTGPARPRVDALDVDPQGAIVARASGVVLGTVTEPLRRADTGVVVETIGNLPAGTLPPVRNPGSRPEIDIGGVVTRPPIDIDIEPGPIKPVPVPIKDVVVISKFESAWSEARATIGSIPPVPARSAVPFGASAAKAAVLAATDPASVVPRRLKTMLSVRGTSLMDLADTRLVLTPAADTVMAFPELPMPVYELLARYDRDRFLPGVEAIPPNAVTLLETNPRFVAAFMVGMNHELNRELLWREYPTDRRGTSMRHFWGWFDGGPDIAPIHEWDAARELGRQARGGTGGQIVLLVRGDLMRRYPNTVVLAWRAAGPDLKDPPGTADIRRPVFGGRFDPDVIFFGFSLTEDDLKGGAWFFVLQEQPTEPRFGFDDGAPPAVTPRRWSDATWQEAGAAAGDHLVIGGNRLGLAPRDGVAFATNSANLAAATLQKPVRVAVNSSRLFAPG